MCFTLDKWRLSFAESFWLPVYNESSASKTLFLDQLNTFLICILSYREIIRAYLQTGSLSICLAICLSVCSQICFFVITLAWIDQLYLNWTRSHSSLREDPYYFGVKGSKVKVTSEGSICLPANLFPDDNSCLDWSVVFKLHMHIISIINQGRPLLILGQKVKSHGHKWV